MGLGIAAASILGLLAICIAVYALMRRVATGNFETVNKWLLTLCTAGFFFILGWVLRSDTVIMHGEDTAPAPLTAMVEANDTSVILQLIAFGVLVLAAIIPAVGSFFHKQLSTGDLPMSPLDNRTFSDSTASFDPMFSDKQRRNSISSITSDPYTMGGGEHFNGVPNLYGNGADVRRRYSVPSFTT